MALEFEAQYAEQLNIDDRVQQAPATAHEEAINAEAQDPNIPADDADRPHNDEQIEY